MSRLCWMGLIFLTAAAGAQTAVTTPGGTINRIPKYTGNYIVGDSVLSENNGDLLVGGTVGIQFSSNRQLIGTIGGSGSSFSVQANSVYDNTGTGGLFFMGGSQRGDELKSQALILGNSANYYPQAGTQTGVLVDGSTGVNKVGIGMLSGSHPGAQLEVNGGIKLSPGGNGSITFPDGSVQATSAWSTTGTLNVGTNTSGWNTPALINIGGSDNVGLAFGTTHYGTLMGTFEGNWSGILNPFIIQPGGTSMADHPIVLTTVQNNPTNGLVIQNSGNIGLGTISPGFRLEVNGDIKLSSGSNGKIIFPDGSSLSSASGVTNSGTPPASGPVTNLPDITDVGGRVGIGTTAPSTPLQVVGTGDIASFGEASPANGKQLVLSVNTAGNGYGAVQSVYQGSGYTSLALNPNGGNVGITNTNPAGSLDIGGVGGLIVSANTNLDPGQSFAAAPLAALKNSNRMLLGWNRSGGAGEIDLISAGTAQNSNGFRFYDYKSTGAMNLLMAMPGNGNIGIGTDSPSAKLEVNGNLKVSGTTTTNSIKFPDGSEQTTAANSSKVGGSDANKIGIDISNSSGSLTGLSLFTGGSSGFGVTSWANASIVESESPNGLVLASTNAYGNGIGGPITFQINRSNVAVISTAGNLGIGTTNPGTKLEVNGSITLTAGSGASMTFPDRTVQSTAWNGLLSGGDYAESVDVSGDRRQYGPGDVMVIDQDAPGRFLRSAEPYSTMAAGIYSTKPGLVGRRQTTERSASTTEIPMAMVGIVPIKVSAENGRIKVGDLLVTSSTLGYAMKGTDRGLMLGAVLGKALGTLDAGKGVIEVLVSLQ